ncbi:hypothetical protein, partial [Aeromonas veronii]|uniref:hypothetical protein n=1 Tax=Aeromonas veronii TaxID=654 RepID=UPI001C59C2E1
MTGLPRHPGHLGRRLAVVVAATVAGAVLLVAAGTFVVVALQLVRGQDVALLREATRVQRSLQDGGGLQRSDGSGACAYVGQPACSRIVDVGDT